MASDRDPVVHVARYVQRLKFALDEAKAEEWIQGEVQGLKWAPSGHAYFTLKDEREDAILDCVMYRFHAQRARRQLSDGARVLVRGAATIYAPRGRLQFVVETLKPAGRGALLEALEKLKSQLQEEGLFAPERKRPLPSDPRVIGVVTSPSGAAFVDIQSVAFRRGPARLVLSPALVQGEGAARSLIRAVDLIERHPLLDVLVIGRGGGSSEDLMCFNDEELVRRLARVRVPVVSAVGHEIDFTLVDLVADVRAATPSQAAELVVPDAEVRIRALARVKSQILRGMRARLVEQRAASDSLRASLSDPRFLIVQRQQDKDELSARLERSLAQALGARKSELNRAEQRLHGRHPRAVVAQSRAALGPLSARLSGAMRLRLESLRSTAEGRAARVRDLSPLGVLARGYAIATKSDGRAVRRADEVAAGERVNVRVAQGSFETTVTRVRPEVDANEGST
jgi:exodeoxyribonuclease VII large subunit